MSSTARKASRPPPRTLGDYTIEAEGPALVIRGLRVTPNLIDWLKGTRGPMHDELVVTIVGSAIAVRRGDGGYLSDREIRHVFGLAAAHYVEPLSEAPTAEEMLETLS